MYSLRALRQHLIFAGLLVVIVASVYARVSGAWFCGYDDFNELHRAAFEDSSAPVRMLTATHFVGYMYRPVTSGLQYFTWNVFKHNPSAFRVRNLAMHVVSVVMLYGIVWLLVGSRVSAACAALLFGVHPIANENIVVAIWTNATAYALFFTSFFAFLHSVRMLRQAGNWRPWLLASLVFAFPAIFTYEPTIVVFALMALYLAIFRVARTPSRTYLVTLFAGIGAELMLFFIARHLVVTQPAPLNSLAVIARNGVMYALALFVPVDFVFANATLGTPLPNAMRFTPKILAVLLIAALLFIVAAVLLVRGRMGAARLSNADRATLTFLAAATPLGVLPLLLFREHPSEHDLYPCLAFYCALLSIVFYKLLRYRAIYGALVVSLAVLFTSATLVRNDRVVQCAAVAQRIVSRLPLALWSRGDWLVKLAPEPPQTLWRPYALYDVAGLLTLEVPESGVSGAEDAVQILTHNERVQVEIVSATSMASGCRRAGTCFWVSSSGSVTDVSGPHASRAMQPEGARKILEIHAARTKDVGEGLAKVRARAKLRN